MWNKFKKIYKGAFFLLHGLWRKNRNYNTNQPNQKHPLAHVILKSLKNHLSKAKVDFWLVQDLYSNRFVFNNPRDAVGNQTFFTKSMRCWNKFSMTYWVQHDVCQWALLIRLVRMVVTIPCPQPMRQWTPHHVILKSLKNHLSIAKVDFWLVQDLLNYCIHLIIWNHTISFDGKRNGVPKKTIT